MAGPAEGWNAPELHHIDDQNVKRSLQDLRDYLGPYSIERYKTANSANKAAGALFKAEFNATANQNGDKLKVSTDGFGVVVPWKGLYRVEYSHGLQIVAGTSTAVDYYIYIAVLQYDEVTIRRTSAYQKTLCNPAIDGIPLLTTADTVPCVAGDRIYGYASWLQGTGVATSAASFGAAAPDYFTNMTVTYVGKT